MKDLASRLEKVASLIEQGVGATPSTPAPRSKVASNNRELILMDIYKKAKTASYLDAFSEAMDRGAI